ncbi:alcohol dehydrogenase catalytic domain-containing protein [Rhodococcus opacus]|uniref:alcohol dehydrogenase catalytic domain-containing protein n=1 Tax=Rhodococcus opacus TaxID=37919 RepID=UPI00352C4ADE
MRALVAREGAARIEHRPIPTPGDTDVVVRTTAASLCSADVGGVTGEFAVADGTIIGHEAVGVVHAVGALVEGFTPGQRVAVSSGTACGHCLNCQRGADGHCGNTVWGAYSSGVSRDGSLAEYFTVPHATRNLAAIPDEVEDAIAVCVTDTMASGTTGPEAARIPLGGSVAVFGQGHVGLGAVAGARLLGAGRVITVKARPGGEEIATALGADICLNLSEHDVTAEISRLTGGTGVDCAVEASGVMSSFPRAVEATRIGGTIVVLSSFTGTPDAALSIPLAQWGWGIGDKTILSTFARTGSERLARLLRLVQAGRVDLNPLITHRYRFDQAEQAFADVAARVPGLVKPLICF